MQVNTFTDPDHELVQQLRTTELRSRAFEELVVRYQERIYFFVRKMLIDHEDTNDVTQNVFIKAWRSMEGFRQDAKLSTWLYRIATNESLNFIEKRKRIAGIPLEDVEYGLPGYLQEDVLYEGDEIQQKLQAAVAALPEKQKLVFILKYFEEKKYEEIAEITGTSEGALKASYHHAVTKIKQMLSGD